jgi:hypothetical protein
MLRYKIAFRAAILFHRCGLIIGQWQHLIEIAVQLLSLLKRHKLFTPAYLLVDLPLLLTGLS